MYRKYKIGMVFIIIGILIPSIFIINEQINKQIVPDPPEEPLPYDPYLKSWEEHSVSYSGPDGYYVLNYTIPTNYIYYNHFDQCGQDNYPLLYIVPSNLVDDFLDAWINDTIGVEMGWNPIVDEIYEIVTYPRWYGNDYTFTPPYLDNWFIFLCCQYGGQQMFTYSDAIYDH